MSLFSSVALAPRDPILGLNEQFAADPRKDKVNLGVGAYFDESGKIPLLACVRTAEQRLLQTDKAYSYLPIDGMPAYDDAVRKLVFGADSAAVTERRIATVQSLGGTGALKITADFLRQIDGHAKVLISDPSWANHQALFSRAGFDVQKYRYYNSQTKSLDVAGMLEDLQAARPGTIVILHACCHNPTGYEPSAQQWQDIIRAVQAAQLVPVLDIAYQGFAQGLEQDGAVIRAFTASGMAFFVTNSFSKNFSLYGQRVGALSVVCDSEEEADRVLSQLKIVVRTNYSNPPIHGAAVVATVLNDAALRQQWEGELATMRERIKTMRAGLADGLRAAGVTEDVSFITKQVGMFSYTGLSKPQMERLRDEFGIYGTMSGRICMAALNQHNLGYTAHALAQVMR